MSNDNNNDSILQTIKTMLGYSANDASFDTDIIVHINSEIMKLAQIGVGKSKFLITGNTETWSDYIGSYSDEYNFQSVKTYIYIKVRLIFDPPASSFVLDALKEEAKELEWRLKHEAESPSYKEEIQNDE